MCPDSQPDRPQTAASSGLTLAILTISDTRTPKTDRSGSYLREQVLAAGHTLVDYQIVPDNLYQIRAIVAPWIAQADPQVIVTTGGTGITQRDITPEAIVPLLDRTLPGFGELFRHLSYGDIGAATLQSRAFAGIANGTLIFSLPGSPGACATAWTGILSQQLNPQTKPCNFVQLLPRLGHPNPSAGG